MTLRQKFSSEEISGFLDQGTSVTGELQFSGTMRVDGEFHGSISTNDKLIIGERAQVHADVQAGEIEIYGKVLGNIHSKKRIEIHATGRVNGELRTPILVIEEGGVFDGSSYMAETEISEKFIDTTHKLQQENQGS